MKFDYSVVHESWPIEGAFRIARGAKRVADVVVVTLASGGAVGFGECVPYARYGESVSGTMRTVRSFLGAIKALPDRQALMAQMPAGAARNAIDCALIDLECKRSGEYAAGTLAVPRAGSLRTAYTLSLDSPEKMSSGAAHHAAWNLLKLKLGGDDISLDAARLSAVREAAPCASLMVDANESWTPAYLESMLEPLEAERVVLLEQPLPAGDDEMLVALESPVPIGADESVHDSLDLVALAHRYSVLNLKLDKTGGLTRARAVKEAARRAGLDVMVGCMVATSLSMLPAMLLAGDADFVDLDGGALLARDRVGGVDYSNSIASWPKRACWGGPA